MKAHDDECVETSALGIDDHHLEKETVVFVGELAPVCAPIVLNMFVSGLKFDRPDILCTVNTLARAGTKWKRAIRDKT